MVEKHQGGKLSFDVYEDMRREGWTVKSGLKFGSDFVLYEGSLEDVHSKYVSNLPDLDEHLDWNLK
jgi:tRNA splicing endonuclease